MMFYPLPSAKGVAVRAALSAIEVLVSELLLPCSGLAAVLRLPVSELPISKMGISGEKHHSPTKSSCGLRPESSEPAR